MEETTKTTAIAGEEYAAPATPIQSPLPEHVPPGEAVEELEPRDPWKKVRKLALRQLDRFMSLEPKVLRGDDPDAIHDIRVASRRLQQVLDLLYPAPYPAEIRKLRRRIRRARRALGEVRNGDVLLARIERHLSSKRAARRDAWDAVHHYLRQRRARDFEKSARKLSRLNLAVFYVRLKSVLAPTGSFPLTHAVQGVDETAFQSPEEFHHRLGTSLEQVWNAFDAQVAQSHRDPRSEVIHGVRIAAKRLRYLIEVIHEFEVSGSRRTLAWLRGMQGHLGNWHDLEVLEQMMIEMVARPKYLRDHLQMAMSVEKLIVKNRTDKVSFRQKYFRMTQDAEGLQQVRDWVTRLVASPAEILTKTR